MDNQFIAGIQVPITVTSTASTGIKQEFASPAEKGESPVRGLVVTMNLPHMSIARRRPTTSGATNSFHGGVVIEGDETTVSISRIFGRFKDMPTSNIQPFFAAHTGAGVVCAVRNGIECSTTTQSSVADDVTKLPPLSDHHSYSADITGRHDMQDGTYVPISIIFRRFRNLSIIGLQSSYEVILAMHIVKEIYMHPTPDPPALIQQLLTNTHFMENIRAYNQMFAMTSFRENLMTRLYNMGGMCGYELPTSDILGGIVFESGPRSRTDFDVIIKFKGGPPKRINKLHQSYMSLQFPILFIFVQLGFYPKLRLKPRDGMGQGKRIFEQKVKDFVKFLKEVKTFGYVTAVLYTIEFQKEIDECIYAELPDPVKDPRGFKVVSELMLHGPHGAANLSATCMHNGCKSPIEVRTVENKIFPTYRGACEALGLLDPSKLWAKHWEAMRDDIPKKISKSTGFPNYHVNTTELQGYVLYKLEVILNGFEKCVKDFRLQPPPEYLLKDLENKLFMEEKNYNQELLM
uniref:Helitron helicase-like domain-containing protein n=1 Tax=Tanacetum cinerariifolium TaxID=118510 RepID=A0A6L2LCF4_TANCI|nr:helitron helicase-like domain-containing protein [Tanacetum cinerariifolium]